jgi:hypothetical protein
MHSRSRAVVSGSHSAGGASASSGHRAAARSARAAARRAPVSRSRTAARAAAASSARRAASRMPRSATRAESSAAVRWESHARWQPVQWSTWAMDVEHQVVVGWRERRQQWRSSSGGENVRRTREATASQAHSCASTSASASFWARVARTVHAVASARRRAAACDAVSDGPEVRWPSVASSAVCMRYCAMSCRAADAAPACSSAAAEVGVTSAAAAAWSERWSRRSDGLR